MDALHLGTSLERAAAAVPRAVAGVTAPATAARARRHPGRRSILLRRGEGGHARRISSFYTFLKNMHLTNCLSAPTMALVQPCGERVSLKPVAGLPSIHVLIPVVIVILRLSAG